MKKSIEMMLARVLVDTVINGVHVMANQLAEGPEDVVKHHCKNGDLDMSKKAVEYCQKNEAKVVSLVEEPEPEPITDAVIVEAIRQLDEKDESLWTKSGSPKTEAIEAVLKVEKGAVRGAHRDAAWKMIQDGEV